MLFRKKKDEKKVGFKSIQGESHGYHFITDDENVLKQFIVKGVNEGGPAVRVKREFAGMGTKEILGKMLNINKSLSLSVLLVKLDGEWTLATAYPILWKTSKIKGKLKKIYEWDNEIEANAEIRVGDATFVFFATDYFLGKTDYLKGALNEFSLWLIGYRLWIHPFKGKKIKMNNRDSPFREVSMEEAEIFLPLPESPALDDYYVTGRVTEISEVNVLNEPAYLLKIHNSAIDNELSVVVSKKHAERKPSKNEMVGIAGWLEGKYLS